MYAGFCLVNMKHFAQGLRRPILLRYPNSAAFPTTQEKYSTLCKKHGLAPQPETLEDGITAIHWIGLSSTKK